MLKKYEFTSKMLKNMLNLVLLMRLFSSGCVLSQTTGVQGALKCIVGYGLSVSDLLSSSSSSSGHRRLVFCTKLTGMKVICFSPPSRSGSTTSFFMFMSEYGQPKALRDTERYSMTSCRVIQTCSLTASAVLPN